MIIFATSSSSSTVDSKRWWNRVWNCNMIPPKMQQFLKERMLLVFRGTIRDHDGRVLVCWAPKIVGGFDVLSAELIKWQFGKVPSGY
ncbi:hypothetical protein TorRG33x02_218410 [Trema orientale]|uniref:Uncharacterized protein n=1 Tax=Trema orientale TaxID=63057 RepID=A0A2P5E9Z1_TREOI|nr:hypothetical protein TorRG33x02_218410 [Trema orientale]